MAQHRSTTTSKHCGNPPPLSGQHAMPDGIDTRVHASKPAPRQPKLDRTGPDPGRKQLGAGDDAVLAIRQLPDHPIGQTFP